MKQFVVNFYGGPGSGKSSMATGVFSYLKFRGVNAEYVSEFAKGVAWEQRSKKVLDAQEYIFAKQHFMMRRLVGEVDVIVTDSPLLLSLVYGQNFELKNTFKPLVLETYNLYDNFNIFLLRVKEYNPKGRFQSEDEAIEKDNEILQMLNENVTDYSMHEGAEYSVKIIGELILEKLKNG